jgi:glutamine synthetase
MAGVLHHAKSLAALTSPIVNSYKRLVPGTPRSGATWAPVYITYGPSNRTQMIRLPGPGRIENRAVDGSANPYLAIAALLAAGLDGIENKMDPGAANTSNLYEVEESDLAERGIRVLPMSLREALGELEKDEILARALGTDFTAYYVKVKNEEWRQYQRNVSNWEVERYLMAF